MSDLFCVKLEGTVLLKLIQHCQDTDSTAIGQLIGLESSNSLEVTNCFSLPSNSSIGPQELEEYSKKMCEQLKDLFFENSVIGWYQRSDEGAFLDISSIEYQYNMQIEIPNAVMVVYDPVIFVSGGFPLKAYRLTQEFLDFFSEEEFTTQRAAALKVDSTKVFSEIPLRIENSMLTNAFLAQYAPDPYEVADKDCYEPFIKKHLEALYQGLDELVERQQKQYGYAKAVQRQKQQQKAHEAQRAAENKKREERGEPLLELTEGTGSLYRMIPPPSRLESLLVSQQLNSLSEELQEFCGESQAKVDLLMSLSQK
ncbi:unnamed protein product [Blepharisma stoltei]|uniref:MPN domain-containing protein n=1 Tax=Blepharisma stoltei TaxID=1481888 RepID=A0AAU9IPE6_9CILI|nr:unnamed protein product [Blepharisma stoltei]